MGVTERVTDIITPLLDELGIELIDLQFNGGVLRVSADTPGGIDMGSIRAATRAISRALDEDEPITTKYTLEVSSPGLERPLRTPTHYQRAIGLQVKIKLNPHVDGERRIAGKLVSAGETEAEIVSESGESRTVAYADVNQAKTVFVWEKNPKQGGPAKGTKPKTDNVAPGKARQAERKAATS